MIKLENSFCDWLGHWSRAKITHSLLLMFKLRVRHYWRKFLLISFNGRWRLCSNCRIHLCLHLVEDRLLSTHTPGFLNLGHEASCWNSNVPVIKIIYRNYVGMCAFKSDNFEILWAEMLVKFQWYIENVSQKIDFGPVLRFISPLTLIYNLQSHTCHK